jgi:hypothetical protein
VRTNNLLKHDSEMKILLGCRSAAKESARAFHNTSDNVKALLIDRPPSGEHLD